MGNGSGQYHLAVAGGFLSPSSSIASPSATVWWYLPHGTQRGCLCATHPLPRGGTDLMGRNESVCARPTRYPGLTCLVAVRAITAARRSHSKSIVAVTELIH